MTSSREADISVVKVYGPDVQWSVPMGSFQVKVVSDSWGLAASALKVNDWPIYKQTQTETQCMYHNPSWCSVISTPDKSYYASC